MLNKNHNISIIIIFIIGGLSLAFSTQIKSMLTSAVNFSLSISAAPEQAQNQNNNVINSSNLGSSTAKSTSKVLFSGTNCINGTVTLKTNDQNAKSQKTDKKGTFTISRSLKPATYDFEITCKNKDKKITKTILYEKIKLGKNETEKFSNINLAETTALLKKPTIAIKSRKPRLFKATLKNF